MSADCAWQEIQFSDVTQAMVCMRLAAAGLPEADLPKACSSGTRGPPLIGAVGAAKQNDQ